MNELSNKKIIALLILGLVSSALIYDMVNKKPEVREGGMFSFITDPIDQIVRFLCFIKAWFAWLAKTVVCILMHFNFFCWPMYIIDTVVGIAVIISTIALKPLGLTQMIDIVANGRDGLNETFGKTLNVRPFEWPKPYRNMCTCSIKPMPIL